MVDSASRRDLDRPLHGHEVKALRGLLGELQWVSTQTMPGYLAECSLLQSRAKRPTVAVVLDLNKLIRRLQADEHHRLWYQRQDQSVLVAWSDASWANRPDGRSTGGMVLALAPASILGGSRAVLSIVSYASGKLPRVARSSLSAEVQALARTEDEAYMTRLLWAEFQGKVQHLEDVLDGVRSVSLNIVVDAKSIYDCLVKRQGMHNLAEKRTALELMAYAQSAEESGFQARWCHGEANLADSMTKAGAMKQMLMYMESGRWALVDDPACRSARRRRAEGLHPFQAEAEFDDNLQDVLTILKNESGSTPDEDGGTSSDEIDPICTGDPFENCDTGARRLPRVGRCLLAATGNTIFGACGVLDRTQR